MALQDKLQELKEFDFSDLDLENIGSWPHAIKVVVWVIAFLACLGLGYKLHIADLMAQHEKEKAKEETLKKDFTRKAGKAVNLEAYRKQMVEMEESFGALVGQLPSDTEVPGLLEDITNKGLENGLTISSIKLQKEVVKEFYVELPISIVVSGSYHDFGAFVSGISGLPRIVTLHDFQISTQEEDASLKMSVTAKTYRYKNPEEV